MFVGNFFVSGLGCFANEHFHLSRWEDRRTTIFTLTLAVMLLYFWCGYIFDAILSNRILETLLVDTNNDLRLYTEACFCTILLYKSLSFMNVRGFFN